MEARDRVGEEEILEALRAVEDPEAGMSIVDLGLVYAVECAAHEVRVDMTLTSPSCPLGPYMVDEVTAAIRAAILGHAPIIAPAVLRRPLPYTAWFNLPLALLHASLALRIAGGLAGEHAIRAAGSLGNALAIAIFIATAATQAMRTRQRNP